MQQRYDLAITLPTMFRSAGTYSLALDGDALYVIRLSGAMGPQVDADAFLAHRTERDVAHEAGVHLGVAMAQPVLKMMEKKFGAQIDAGLDQIETRGFAAMAEEKGSFRFDRGDIKAVEPGKKGAIETLTLKTSARAFPFRIGATTGADLRSFLDEVRQWAGA